MSRHDIRHADKKRLAALLDFAFADGGVDDAEAKELDALPPGPKTCDPHPPLTGTDPPSGEGE